MRREIEIKIEREKGDRNARTQLTLDGRSPRRLLVTAMIDDDDRRGSRRGFPRTSRLHRHRFYVTLRRRKNAKRIVRGVSATAAATAAAAAAVAVSGTKSGDT